MTQIYRRLVVKNVKQLPEAEKLVQEKGLTHEDIELILSTFKLRGGEVPQVAGTPSEGREKSIYNFEPDSSWLNEVSIDNGVVIDGVRVKGLRSVEITSGLSNISTVKMEFLTKINGLDNLQSTFS